MISPSDRFWIAGEQVRGHVYTGQVIDWDQRRWYNISGPLTYIPPDEDVDIELRRVSSPRLHHALHSQRDHGRKEQLLNVVDYLNFELAIVHQDIAPRNLLVDPETDNLLLFDFDRAARIGQPSCFPERNDVKEVVFTLYEIVSRDDHFRCVEHREQDQNSVLSLESWPVEAQLDSHVGNSESYWTSGFSAGKSWMMHLSRTSSSRLIYRMCRQHRLLSVTTMRMVSPNGEIISFTAGDRH